MTAYARKFARDNGLSEKGAAELEIKYTVTGLLHDFDYEKFPTAQEHPFVGNNILAERGFPDDIRRAILSHADYTGVPRETHMEKAL
ncbi:MAG TPA: HD domain-containing protein, partial [Candidatus Sulfotelmatobacter sp.]|nr:HD domain-containing protein [Candidatus Sulfotelmatobacter sp.]